MFNKYMILMTMILFIIFMTFIAQSVSIQATTDITQNLPTDGDLGISSALDFFGVFLKLLTFRLEGIPAVMNLFIFMPLTFGVIYMIIDIIRGNG